MMDEKQNCALTETVAAEQRKPRVAAYVCKSIFDNDDDVFRARQQSYIERFSGDAQIEFLGVFADDNAYILREHRPSLDDLLKKCASREIDVVYAPHFGMFACGILEFPLFMQDLYEYSVRVIFRDDTGISVDTKEPPFDQLLFKKNKPSAIAIYGRYALTWRPEVDKNQWFDIVGRYINAAKDRPDWRLAGLYYDERYESKEGEINSGERFAGAVPYEGCGDGNEDSDDDDDCLHDGFSDLLADCRAGLIDVVWCDGTADTAMTQDELNQLYAFKVIAIEARDTGESGENGGDGAAAASPMTAAPFERDHWREKGRETALEAARAEYLRGRGL